MVLNSIDEIVAERDQLRKILDTLYVATMDPKGLIAISKEIYTIYTSEELTKEPNLRIINARTAYLNSTGILDLLEKASRIGRSNRGN